MATSQEELYAQQVEDDDPYVKYVKPSKPEDEDPYAKYVKPQKKSAPAKKSTAGAAALGAVVGIQEPSPVDIFLGKKRAVTKKQSKPAPKPPANLKEYVSQSGLGRKPEESESDYASRVRAEDKERKRRIQANLGSITSIQDLEARTGPTEPVADAELWSIVSKNMPDDELERVVSNYVKNEWQGSGLNAHDAFRRAEAAINELRDRAGLLGFVNPKLMYWNSVIDTSKLASADPTITPTEKLGAFTNFSNLLVGTATAGAKDIVLDPLLKVMSPAARLAATKLKGGLNAVVKKIEKALSGDSVAEAVRIATKDLNLTGEQAVDFQRRLVEGMINNNTLKNYIDINSLKKEAEFTAEGVAQGKSVHELLGGQPQSLSDVVAKIDKPPRESFNVDEARKQAEAAKRELVDREAAEIRAANPHMDPDEVQALAEKYAAKKEAESAGKIRKNQEKPTQTGKTPKKGKTNRSGNVQQTTETGAETGGAKLPQAKENVGGFAPDDFGTRFRHEDLENSADALGIHLPDKTKWKETWEETERRALSNLEMLKKSLPGSHISMNEGLSKEQRYVAAQQLRSVTDKVNTVIEHMQGKPDNIKEQLTEELDNLLKESERLSGILYKSNSVAGRDLAYSKALIEGPFDEAGILMKAERLSEGTLTGKARTRIGGLASSGKKAQTTAEDKIMKQAKSALDRIRNLADIDRITAKDLEGC